MVRPRASLTRWRRSCDGRDAGGMSALIAASDLMGAASLRKHANIDMLDISAGDGKRYKVFRLAGRGAGVTANASGLVNNFGPFHGLGLWLLEHGSSHYLLCGEPETISRKEEKKTRGVNGLYQRCASRTPKTGKHPGRY